MACQWFIPDAIPVSNGGKGKGEEGRRQRDDVGVTSAVFAGEAF